MTSRYAHIPLFINDYEIYEPLLEDRGVAFIRQLATPSRHPLTEAQEDSINAELVTWEMGTRLEKLSSEHYGRGNYWWVIARYNNKPTDAHFELGDIVYIPKPLGLILAYYTEA